MQTITLTYKDYIVPAVRMTQGSKYADKRAQKYLSSKEKMQWEFKNQIQLNNLNKIPKQTPFHIKLTLTHSSGHRSDLDNIIKAILDALNKIAYPDDRWCDSIHATRNKIKKDNKATIKITY